MKTKSFLIAALIVLSAGMYAVAGDEPGNSGFAVLSVKGSETVKVIYKSEIVEKVKLNLYNEQGTLLFSETRSGNGFIRPLNLKGLPYGEYTVELISAAGKRTEKISYESKTATPYFHVSKVTSTVDKYLLSVKDENANSKINIRIYDNSNNLIHDEVKEISGSFAQLYAIKNFKNSVTFEISDASGNVKVVSF